MQALFRVTVVLPVSFMAVAPTRAQVHPEQAPDLKWHEHFDATFLSGFLWTSETGTVVVGDGSPLDGQQYGNDGGEDFGVNVNMTSSDTNVGTITTSPLAFGANTLFISTAFQPVAAGTSTITVATPPGYDTPSNNTQIDANVAP